MKSLKELSERARTCSNPEWQAELKKAHLALDVALDVLSCEPTDENMRHANCMWSYAHALYEKCPPEADPQPPMSGAPEAALLAA